MTAVEKVPARPGLLKQLMAVVRPELRTEIYLPAPDDPVFIARRMCGRGLRPHGGLGPARTLQCPRHPVP